MKRLVLSLSIIIFSWMLFLPMCIICEIICKVPVAEGLASHPVNGGHCLISDGTSQFLAFYDGEHRMTIAKRTLGETDWDFAILNDTVGWDTHNRILLFMDRRGQLHVTGNMHCAPLRYYRTETPGDIHSFKEIHTWTGKYENRVTYPNLLQLKDGSSHIMYRHGGSGNGMRLLVHYDEETESWSGTGQSFINGMEGDPVCNAYPFGGIQEDDSGTLHVAWCWRETPDVETNFNICYAQSKDKGYTWNRWDGSVYSLPIRPQSAETPDRIPEKAGLMNGGSLVIDTKGRPYIGYTKFGPNGNNQMFVTTPVGRNWKVVQLTDWDKRFWFEGRGTIPESPPMPSLSLAGDDSLQVRYSWKYVSPSSGRFVLTRGQLLSMKPGAYEILPALDAELSIPNVRAINSGPLPDGRVHYMQQETDPPNRDRKPDNPKAPAMIFIVETK